MKLSGVAVAAGLIPAATLFPSHPALRGAGFKTDQSIYRKESRPGGEAARSMRGNHPGFLSYQR